DGRQRQVKVWRQALPPFAFVVFSLSGCASSPQLRQRIESIKELTLKAERQGARRCAPRALAYAQAHLEFAQLFLEHGAGRQLEGHLRTSELNAQAARLQSPAEHCADERPLSSDQDGDGIPDTEDRCPQSA